LLLPSRIAARRKAKAGSAVKPADH
jgi:hypothetical protein